MKNSNAIILFLLSLGLFYTFTNTQYREARALQVLADEYQNILQSISAMAELRDRLLVTYETFPRLEVERINKVLPDHVDTVRLALDLDSAASRYGISIKNIQTTVGTNDGADFITLPEYGRGYEKATISFGFVSDYENFTRLLADLERNLRIMDIKSVSFQAGESGLYDYRVSVDTYWLK